MADEEEAPQLLFFDTYSHRTSDELNIDLVQFDRPVIVSEVRVIPLGTRVNADVPGGVRLGATNPSSFKLEFFVNNIAIPGAATFEKLGKLDYKQNVDIQFIADKKVTTDGLLIYGWYTTITVAVYGNITDPPKAESPPPPPPPQPLPVQPLHAEAAPEHHAAPEVAVSQSTGTAVVPAPVSEHSSKEWDVARDLGFPPPQPQAAAPAHVKGETFKDARHPMDILSNPLPAVPLTVSTPELRPDSFQPEPREARRDSRDRDSRDSRDRELRDSRDRESRDRDSRERDFREAPSDSSDDRRRERDFRDNHRRESPEGSKSLDRDHQLRDSREGSREPRGDLRDYHSRDRSRERDGERSREKEQERTRERERERDKERDRDWEREKERERDRGRDRREHDKDRDSKDRPKAKSPRRRSRTPDRTRKSRSRSRSPLLRSPRTHSPVSWTSGRSQEHGPGRPVKDAHPPVAMEAPIGQVAAMPAQEIEDIQEPSELTDEMQEDLGEEMFDPMMDQLPDDRLDKMYSALSDGEIQEQEVEGYEEISSNEDNLSDFERGEPLPRVMEWDERDDAWNNTISAFNPYTCELAPLETFVDPSLTAYEAEKHRLILSREEDPRPDAAQEILDIIARFDEEDHHGPWVEAMETIPMLAVTGLAYLITKTDHKEMLQKLVAWAFEGLDMDKAMAQPETAYKVRHLKMGIRLAALLCSCDSYVAFHMLTRDVQHKLLDLYCSQYMSSSVKLQIIRALDQTTRLKDGLDWFLGRHPLQVENEAYVKSEGTEATSTGRQTCYQRLIEVITDQQMVRSVVGLSALLRKIHLYEMLNTLAQNVEELLDNLLPPSEKDPSLLQGEGDDPGEGEGVMMDSLSEQDTELICTCLDQALRYLTYADNLIAQPRSTLPARVKFAVTLRPFDPYPNLYHIFNATRLLETLFVLLSSPVTSSQPVVFVSVRDLLQQMLSTLSGALYLSAKPETVNGILRALTQNAEFSGLEYTLEENPVQVLGLQMIYCLQTVQHIDQLRDYHAKDPVEKEVDDSEALGVLYGLFSMMDRPLGRDAVVQMLSLEDNPRILLPFLELTGDTEHDEQIEKSVCMPYAAQLLRIVMRHSDNASMLERFGHRLLQIAEQDFPGPKLPELTEILEWLHPFRKAPTMDLESLPELLELLKQGSEEVLELPKWLVTVLRLLHHMAIPDPGNVANGGVEELRYKYVLLELYSANGFSMLVNILQKVGDLMLLPWQQGLPQSASQGSLMIAIVKPCVGLLKHLLSQLILARGKDFQDLTCLKSLFTMHTLMCSVSLTGTLSHDSHLLQADIVDTILTFTQPDLDTDESQEALTKSLWTRMMKDLFQFVLNSPYTFLGGLLLISELLPLPLPLQSREPLSEEEQQTAVNQRKLWSAHLHPLQVEIQTIIKTLAGSSCQPLQQVLRRWCVQISDLASPSALTIVRGVLDALLESMDTTIERLYPEKDSLQQQERPSRAELRSSGHTSRILHLLDDLINQAPIKTAFIQLAKQGSKSDETYVDILPRLAFLLNVVSEKASHIQAQEFIVSIFQSLCDIEVTMIGSDSQLTLTEQLANSLPCSEQLKLICLALIDHIGHFDHQYSSVLPALRTLVLLMDHDFGFYHVRIALQSSPDKFPNLFVRIDNTFSKDNPDCIATLSAAMECIQFLVAPPEPPLPEEGLPPVERTLVMSPAELQTLLGWKDNDKSHPIVKLVVLLEDYAKEEETLRAIHESVAAIVTLLKIKEEESPPEIAEPLMPPPENLTAQFNMRTVCTLTDHDDERLLTPYWLAMPMADESDQELDLVRCDFEEMSKYCTDFDLKAELSKGNLPTDSTLPKQRKKIRSGRRSQDTINTSRMQGQRGRHFVAPMRGRGFGRGAVNSRHDNFRSRPANTSRPPSMHVDDFMKMENQQTNVPSGPPMMQARRMEKDGNRGGRGGFERGGRGGFGNRGGGRFFNQQGGYNRRDGGGFPRGGYGNLRGTGGPRGGLNTRGGGMGRGGGNMRGSPTKQGAGIWNNRNQQRQGFGGGRGFGRGGGFDRDFNRSHEGRAGSLERREHEGGDRGGRFGGPRGGRGGRGGAGPGMGGWGRPKGDGDRYMQSPGGFGRRERGGRNHGRSFTK